LLEAGLWVGARDRRGQVIGVSTAVPVNEFRPRLDPGDRTIESFDGAIGTRRVGSTATLAEADDDADGRLDEEFLNGQDDDGDGRIDEDVVAIGAQTFGCEYRDSTPEAIAQLLAHTPLSLHVRQLSFTWAEGTEGLDRCALIRYQIENRGPASLFDVYIGFYVDPDAGPKANPGYWRDDRYRVETVSGEFPARGDGVIQGCDMVPFERVVAQVEDVPDGGGTASGGDVPGIVAALILGHTTHRWGFRAPDVAGTSGVVHLGGRATIDHTREEFSDSEKYTLLARGTAMGDSRIDDHRFVLVAGPFDEVSSGGSLELTVALLVAADQSELTSTVSRLVMEYEGRWLDLDGSQATGVQGLETCLTSNDARFCGFTPFRVDHDCDELETDTFEHAGCRNTVIQVQCPHLGPNQRCTDRLTVNTPNCVYVNFDCDRCTPNVPGAETQVHWSDTTVRVSSRPAAKRMTPGDRQVLIEWDNAAELPTARRELPPVAGYRVWRADGWTRPPGVGGPESRSFALIAELPLLGSGLPSPPFDFVADEAPIIDWFPGPQDSVAHYATGRYFFTDRQVTNGFSVFYDVTPFALVSEDGNTVAQSLVPRGRRGDEVVAVAAPSPNGSTIGVVPNPYLGRAEWDLEPGRGDPSGRKILFTGLPAREARIDIFTLAGDRVRTLVHDGRTGSASWDLLSRNGQPVVSGIYLYSVSASGIHERGKLVIVR
jgi:hypothetical protein